MRDFSIYLQSENIYNPKTKEYFNEVIKSYYNESYRSAIVMLYSITIADLLYKLEELKDIYNDVSAKEILDEVELTQSNKSNLSEWESKLIDLIKSKTNLFEASDYLHITSLQKLRHLCAHPVMTQHFELYSPNRETARANIRNILEGVLIKPALLSRKIFDDFLQHLATIKNLSFDDEQLEKHLNNKYFKRFGNQVFSKIFRSLWKIVFKLKDQLPELNREINLKALLILFNNEYSELLKNIEGERDYYSDIDDDNLTPLIQLLNQFPEVYNKLNDSAQILIKKKISADATLDTLAIFLSADIKAHMKKVADIGWDSGYENNRVSILSINTVFEFAIEHGFRDEAYDFLIQMFGNSNQYNQADSRYDTLIKPFLNDFTKKELIKIVKAVNANSQIYDRRKAVSANREIYSRLTELNGGTYDASKYPNFEY